MNCKQTEALLPLYAGRELEEKRATLVAEHLQTCAACARVADEYRESVQLTEQFAAPVFSDGVYAGIRQRVLREIETEAIAPAWSQTLASLFRSRVTWAIASVVLIVVSTFAIYFVVNNRNVEQQLANQPQDDSRADRTSAVNTGEKQQQSAGVPRLHRKKRSRNTLAKRTNTPTPFANPNSAAVAKPLRVEIQTKDPMIRIIWFVQPETKPVIAAPKGT